MGILQQLHQEERANSRARGKQFWFEGRVVHCDSQQKWHKIKHVDGDSEEMTHAEVMQHCKPNQKFSKKSQEMMQDLRQALLVAEGQVSPAPAPSHLGCRHLQFG